MNIRNFQIKDVQIFAVFVFVSLVLVSCGNLRNQGLDQTEEPPARYKQAPELAKTINLDIDRAKLISALEQDVLTDKIRIVEVYHSKQDGQVPFYRLFDIAPQSVYALLGLRTNDVLVAANERYLINANLFKEYVKLLKNVDKAQIEVVRGTETMVFKYNFTDQGKANVSVEEKKDNAA